jgi:hypothetical protein
MESYSAVVLDLATICCFLAIQKRQLGPKMCKTQKSFDEYEDNQPNLHMKKHINQVNHGLEVVSHEKEC